MQEAADLLNNLLKRRSLDRDADHLAKALRAAYPLPVEGVGEADRFEWLLQALAQEAINKTLGWEDEA